MKPPTNLCAACEAFLAAAENAPLGETGERRCPECRVGMRYTITDGLPAFDSDRSFARGFAVGCLATVGTAALAAALARALS